MNYKDVAALAKAGKRRQKRSGCAGDFQDSVKNLSLLQCGIK